MTEQGGRRGADRRWSALRPGRLRHESGIPVDTDADAVVTAVLPLFALAVLVMCVVTVRPLGLHGWGLVGSLLLVVNGAVMLARSLPEPLVSDRRLLGLALVGAPAAGLAWGFDPYSWAEAFGISLAVHVGIRFEVRTSVPLAGTAAATAAVVLAARHGQDGVPPFWFGALILVGLVFGVLRRSRRTQLAAADALVAEGRRAAAGEARAELARDLHDVLAHSLSGVNMQLSMADALFEAGRHDQGRAALKQAQGLVVEGLGEARRAVSVLRAGTIEVVPALQAMVTGDQETLSVDGRPGPLGDLESQTLVRIAQESLTNARRHAPGASVEVRLAWPPGQVVLEVINGPAAAGWERAVGEGGGMGLVGMRERAATVGAGVDAGPVTAGEYAGGWRVHVVLDRQDVGS